MKMREDFSPLMESPSYEPFKRSHLFIELEEYSGERWRETSRWNHALEEERESPKHPNALACWTYVLHSPRDHNAHTPSR